MTARFRIALALAVSLLSVAGICAAAAEDAVLLIDQTSGVVGVQRNGKRLTLGSGDVLQEQDLIVTDRTGRMTLRLARHGFVEVGPGSEVGVERLPFAAYARDLKSIFSVNKGYFRVVWKHPQLSTTWPLYIYMAGHRISLVSGEYFFQNLGTEQRICVAAGQMALQPNGDSDLQTIKPPACARLVPGTPPQVTARNPDDWIAVRRGYNIEATASSLLAQAAAAPTEVAASSTPAAKPVASAPVLPTAAIAVAPAPLPAVPAPAPLPAAPSVAPASNADLMTEQPRVATSEAVAALGPVKAAPVMPVPPVVPSSVMVSPSAEAPAWPYGPYTSAPPAVAPAPQMPPLPSTGRAAKKPLVAAATAAMAAPAPVAPATPATRPVAAAPAVVSTPVGTTPAASNGGNWVVNTGSYSDTTAADREIQRLTAAGYRASSQPATVNGRTWYRVQLVGFGSESAARSAAKEVQAKLGIKSIWVFRQ